MLGELGKRAASGVARCPSVACGVGGQKNARPSPGRSLAACARDLPYPATVHNQPRASVAECSAGFVAETLASKLQTVDAKDGECSVGFVAETLASKLQRSTPRTSLSTRRD